MHHKVQMYLQWNAPTGDWKLVALFVGRTFQKVKRAAPGGEGCDMDHFSPMAVKSYFEKFDKAFKTNKVNFPRTFFNDSYEVYGADWTPAFLKEFAARRGYRLENHFPEFISQERTELTRRLVSVARRRLEDKEGKPDQSGYHLVVLAKNLKGYHNLIKLVSKAWTKGFYMRPRTDRAELEKYHEGLIVCSACLGGEVPRRITAGQFEEAEEAIRWYKNLFGDDYYLELQRHKATVARANHEVYPMQQVVNEKLIEYAKKYNIKLVCTNDVHFVDEENAEAHDRLICLSTGKDH